MSTEPPFHPLRARLAGLAATVAAHLALLLCWQLAHNAPAPPEAAERIQWVNVPAIKETEARDEAPARLTPQPARQAARARARPQRAQARPAEAPPALQMAAPSALPSETVADQAPGKSAYDILQQARKDLGKISKDLGKEFPGKKITAPRDTPQTRLEKGIELAHELAPPKWYEAPKIKEIVDPGGYGRKRYRIITANGTYCITYESNHAPDGIDVIAKGMQQKRTTCPKDELPPTTQKGL